MADTIDWPPPRRPRRRGRIFLLFAAFAVLFSGSTALSYYVDALWFDSLGYSAVFWKTLNLQGAVFSGFAALPSSPVRLISPFKPASARLAAGRSDQRQPITLPVEPVLS